MDRQKIRGEHKKIKGERYQLMLMLICMITLAARVPLYYIIGENGISYYSVSNELFVLFGILFTYGLGMAVSYLVRYRIRREQYKNAGKVLQTAVVLSLGVSLLLAILFLIPVRLLVQNVLHFPLGSFFMLMVIPAILFYSLQAGLLGYFEGNGSKIPSIHTYILEAVVFLGGSLLGASLLERYGKRVAALLRSEDFVYAYGALGAGIGMVLSSILGFLYLLFLYFLYKRNTKRAGQEQFKGRESSFELIPVLVTSAAPMCTYLFLLRIYPLLDGVFVLKEQKEGVSSIALWGSYYGKYLVLIEMACLILMLPRETQMKNVLNHIDREEYRNFRLQTASMLHYAILTSLPVAVFMAVFSKNILNLVYHGNNDIISTVVSLGSILIVLYTISGYLTELLIWIRKMRYVLICHALALVVHLIVLLLLIRTMKQPLMAVVTAGIVGMLVQIAAEMFLSIRNLQYRMDWLKDAAYPVACAATTGLLAMLLNKALSAFAGTTIALFICLPLSLAGYVALLLVVKAVREDELETMPLGGVLIWFGKLLRLM